MTFICLLWFYNQVSRTSVAVCHLLSLPLIFNKTVCLFFLSSHYFWLFVRCVGMMTRTSVTVGIEKAKCPNHSKVSEPQQTFNSCVASYRHARKSTACPAALWRDETELTLAL